MPLPGLNACDARSETEQKMVQSARRIVVGKVGAKLLIINGCDASFFLPLIRRFCRSRRSADQHAAAGVPFSRFTGQGKRERRRQ